MRLWMPCVVLLAICVCRVEAQRAPVRDLQIIGEAEYSFRGESWLYYVLQRSSDLKAFLPVSALRGGRFGLNTIRDDVPPRERAFYRLQSVPFTDPLDSDGDGMDDRYELWHSYRLDMLNDSDASADPDGDGRTHLDDYQALTTSGLQDVVMNEGITGGTVDHLVRSLSDPLTLYTSGGAVFKSVDGGVHWHYAGIQNLNHLVVDPTNEDIVYGVANGGIAKTEDGGLSWREIPFLTGNEGWPQSLTVDPNDPAVLYAITRDTEIARSLDGGESWAIHFDSFPRWSIADLTIDPSDSNIMFAHGDAFFKSVDGGLTWQEHSVGALNDEVRRVEQVIPVRETPGTVFLLGDSNIYQSTNAGESWKEFPRPIRSRRILVTNVDPLTLYAITWSDLWRYTDVNESWEQMLEFNTVTRKYGVSHVTANPDDPDRLVVGTTGDGLFWSEDGGDNWSPGKGFSGELITALTEDPNNEATVFAATGRGNVYLSADGGQTWTSTVPGISDDTEYVSKFAVGGGAVYAVSNHRVLKWDGIGRFGDRMRRIEGIEGNIQSAAVSPSNSNIVYVGYTSVGVVGVMKTTNSGASWRNVSGGVFESDSWQGSPAGIAVDPNDPNIVYVGISQVGVFKTMNGGESWEAATGGIPPAHYLDFFDIVIDPNDSNTVFAGTWYEGIYRSKNAGQQWERLDQGLLGQGVATLGMDPMNSKTLVAGTIDSGFFKSVDGGDTWWQQPYPLGEVQPVAAFLHRPDGLLIGTNRGVLKRK